MKAYFNHEKLHVYQEAIKFVAWCTTLMQRGRIDSVAKDQINRASISIALNIAEGNGKTTYPDRRRFFDIERGSALECAAILDVLSAKGQLDDGDAEIGKQMRQKTVFMLAGLMKPPSDRVAESEAGYGDGEGEFDQDHDQDHDQELR